EFYDLFQVSCHGIPWITIWLASIWIIWNKSYFEVQVNFFIGLIIDIIAVSMVKAIARRKRPPSNRSDMLFAVGPDKFSFPSGHASRACYIAFFFVWLHPVRPLLMYILWLWAAAVSCSRVLMRRHYILDVLGGVALALVETWVVYCIWFSQYTSEWLVTWITEESAENDEYNV
ncbi:hypothetical protein AAG570_012339, partial [Ranatra chinensis]